MATETGGGPRTPTGRRRRCSARPQQRARRPQQKPGRGSCGGAGRTAAGRQTTEHAPRQQRAAGGPRGVPQAAWRAAAAGEAMTAELYSPPGCGGHPPPNPAHARAARRGGAGRRMRRRPQRHASSTRGAPSTRVGRRTARRCRRLRRDGRPHERADVVQLAAAPLRRVPREISRPCNGRLVQSFPWPLGQGALKV